MKVSLCCDAIPIGEICDDMGRCSQCKENTEFHEEEEDYSVNIKASFGVMAESQEDAEKYILDQFSIGNPSYTYSVEVDNG